MKEKLIILLLVVCSCLYAQDSSNQLFTLSEHSYALETRMQYGYNSTLGNYVGLVVNGYMKPASNFILSLGVCAQTANVYSVIGSGLLVFPTGREHGIYLLNNYLYRGFVSDNFQEFNAGLSIGFKMNYFNILIGNSIRLMSQLKWDGGYDMRYICEPFNMLYSVEGLLRKNSSYWNVGLKISNMRAFVMERMYQPTVSIGARYDLKPGIRFTGESGVEPAGVFNVSTVGYNYYLQLGLQLLW